MKVLDRKEDLPKEVTNAIREASQVIETKRDDLADLLAQLIRIPSVNPIFSDCEVSSELECQKFIDRWLADLGCATELWEPDPLGLEKRYKGKPGFVPGRSFEDRPNLLARFPGRRRSPAILLTGHADVVGADEPGWIHPPFEAHIDQGYLYGRGAVDMKGGLAAMLGAIAAIKWAGLSLLGDVWFASVVDEEAGGMGTLALADELLNKDVEISAALLGEPTNLNIAPLSRGILWGELVVEGRSGHIEVQQPHWRNGGAVDAITKALGLIRDLGRLNEEWALAPQKNHPLLPCPCSIRTAQIEGGHSPTSYADHCRIVFNVQYLPGEQDELGRGTNVRHEIEDFLQKVVQLDSWLRAHPPKVKWIIDADSYELDANHPFVRTCRLAAHEVGSEARIRGVETHTDAGRLGYLAGIPTITFGPGNMRLAHQVNEHVSLEEIIVAVKVYTAVVLSWIGIV